MSTSTPPTPHAPPTPFATPPRTYPLEPRVVPSFPCYTLGGLDVWTDRVYHLQAKPQFYLDLVVLLVHRASIGSSPTAHTTTSASYDPTEGDANCQTCLANLLYEWTDKATEWSLFLRCDVSSPTLGLDIWNAITLKYQLHNSRSCDVNVHTNRLAVLQRNDESILSYWSNIQVAITHLAS